MFPEAKGNKKHHLCEACSKPRRGGNTAEEARAIEQMQLIRNLPEILNKLRKPQMLLYHTLWDPTLSVLSFWMSLPAEVGSVSRFQIEAQSCLYKAACWF